MKTFLTLLISMVSWGAVAYDGWSGANKIASIRVYSEAKVYITMPDAENPKQCSNTNFLVLTNADTDVGKRQYSALLTAYASGKVVDLALTGCSSGGTSGYPMIEQVWLK